ncbi:MAG TPA: methyltransferase domain-containing protein, partial [Candidatus Limnocylindria bacterium]|nr:methyltransferase domain-containing protein [Candidatus Limnocylindria bacterium]
KLLINEHDRRRTTCNRNKTKHGSGLLTAGVPAPRRRPAAGERQRQLSEPELHCFSLDANLTKETMTTKSPDLSETFISSERADAWHRAKARREETTGAATEMMLDLANLRLGDRVLELAAGTGDLSLMIAKRVGPTGHVLATDISAAMLDRAAQAAREANLINVETRVMNAENLELEANSFDAVLCRMGLMLFPNPLKTLTSMQLRLKPEKRVAVMVHSAAARNPYHGLPQEIVRRLGKMASPPPKQPGMFALGGPGVLERTFRNSRLRDVSVCPVAIRRKFSSLAEAIKSMKGSNAVLQNLLATLNEADQGRAWKEIEQAMSQFESANGFEAPGEVLIGVGTK